MNEIIGLRLRDDHLESDLSEFIILKNKHEKTSGRPLDNDLLVMLLMQNTVGPLQQHLRLNVRNIVARSLRHWRSSIATPRVGA